MYKSGELFESNNKNADGIKKTVTGKLKIKTYVFCHIFYAYDIMG